MLLVGGILAFQQLEHFLISDARFQLSPPADYGLDSPDLQVIGMDHVSRQQVMKVFSGDFGRSVYLFPASRRRISLMAIDWVKDASISRIWPNKVLVRITERQPVAFAELSGGGPTRFLLIDEEGVLLQPEQPGKFKLPVVIGIREESERAERRVRIQRMLRLMKEAGRLGDSISEIDVSNGDNLKVTEQVENRAIVLMIGDHNFAQRLQNFVANYPEIRRRLPNATTLDLRLEDRITAVNGE